MAVRWAVANGNWNNTAVWNGGTLPEDGDVVYMNGYNVTVNTDINVGNGVITNKINPETSRTGGALAMPSISMRRFITANVECGDVPMITALGGNITINGNVETGTLDGVLVERVGGVINLVVVGNVVTNQGNLVRYQAVATNYGVTMSINGNLTTNQGTLITSYSGTASVTISGNVIANARFYASNITSITIIGSLLLNYVVLQTTTLNITGKIEYKSSNNIAGVLYQNLTIGNPETFTWHDVTEPRVNPFIILTDGDLNNRQQYPAEDRVVQGVEYAFGEKVGTFEVDYPPESVVLNGYEYDNGNKVGTLEVVDIGDYPAESDVKVGVRYGNDEYEGTFQPVADYPAENDVLKDVPYAYDQMHGKLNLDYPPEEVVLEGYVYDNEQKTGSLAQTAQVVNTINVYKKK